MPTVRPVGTRPGDKIAATPPATIVSRGIVLKDSCSMAPSPQKVTFREMGVRGVLIYCRHRCGHHTKANADGRADGRPAERHGAEFHLYRLRSTRCRRAAEVRTATMGTG